MQKFWNFHHSFIANSRDQILDTYSMSPPELNREDNRMNLKNMVSKQTQIIPYHYEINWNTFGLY